MDKTRIYFCIEPSGDELAVMVDQMNGSMVTVYSHNGQHSEAEVEYVKECAPMDAPEQSDLYRELQGQGYTDIEVVPTFFDAAGSEKPVDECCSKLDAEIEAVIGGSPICESVKAIANVLFEYASPYQEYSDMQPNQLYELLLQHELFTQSELDLVTNGWGMNTNTLDMVCQVRYGMDTDQLLAEQN